MPGPIPYTPSAVRSSNNNTEEENEPIGFKAALVATSIGGGALFVYSIIHGNDTLFALGLVLVMIPYALGALVLVASFVGVIALCILYMIVWWRESNAAVLLVHDGEQEMPARNGYPKPPHDHGDDDATNITVTSTTLDNSSEVSDSERMMVV